MHWILTVIKLVLVIRISAIPKTASVKLCMVSSKMLLDDCTTVATNFSRFELSLRIAWKR